MIAEAVCPPIKLFDSRSDDTRRRESAAAELIRKRFAEVSAGGEYIDSAIIDCALVIAAAYDLTTEEERADEVGYITGEIVDYLNAIEIVLESLGLPIDPPSR